MQLWQSSEMEVIVFMNILVGDLLGQPRIQSVQTFDQQHGPFAQLEVLAVELSAAGHEIIFRNLYFLSVK